MKAKKGHICYHHRSMGSWQHSPGCGGEVEYDTALYYTLPKKGTRMKRVPGYSCRLHYLEHHFGIVALKCPRCHDKIAEETDAEMEDRDIYTYITADVLLVPSRYGWWTGNRAFSVKCWHCGFVLYRSSRFFPSREYIQRYYQAFEWMRSVKGLNGVSPEDVRENSVLSIRSISETG